MAVSAAREAGAVLRDTPPQLADAVGTAAGPAINVAALVAAGINPTQARQFEGPLQATFARFAIDTPLRQAAFVAQCAHESTHFTTLEESLFYRKPERICAIFKGSVKTLAAAVPLACNPQALACCVDWRVHARSGSRRSACSAMPRPPRSP